MDLQTILTAVAIPVGGAAFGLAGKWILAGQKDIKKLIDDGKSDLEKADAVIANRVKSLEVDNRTFMSRDELRAEFEHESRGREMIKEAAEYATRKNADDIIKLRESVARLDQSDISLHAQYHDLKNSMESGFTKLDNKLEKMSDCIGEIAKKV